MLSRRLGGNVRLRSAILLEDASSSRACERSFWRLRISGGKGYEELHAKVLPKKKAWSTDVRRASRLEARLSGLGLPVADFLGSVAVGTNSVFVWEHRQGVPSSDFRHLELFDAQRIAQAVAQISALSNEIAGDVVLTKGIRWVERVTGRIEKVLTAKQFASVEREFEQFAAVEQDTIAALKSIEAATLTHNDIKGPNVLISPKTITLVDWESAALGPHGASLRRFARHGREIERVVAQGYVRALMQCGVQVDIAQVLFVMRFQEIFWALCTGVRQARARRIITGLQLVPEILSRPEAY